MMLKLSKFLEDLRLHDENCMKKGKIALGTVLPKNPENSELSPWPKIKRLVSF